MKTEELADVFQREEAIEKNKVSRKELFAMIREQIRHEDGLVNQRQNWLLLSQGFLFLLFSSLLTADATVLPHIKWLLLPVACMGVLLNTLSFIGILEAFRSLNELRSTWDTRYSKEKNDEGFPQITWVGTHGALHTATGTPILISLVWGVIFPIVFQGEPLVLALGVPSIAFLFLFMIVRLVELWDDDQKTQ